MKYDKRNIGRDPHIAPGVYYLEKELSACIDGDRIIVEKKESEDERIRKQCIKLIREAYSTKYEAFECIAWLEKQKETDHETYKTERGIWVESVISNTFPEQDGDFISEEDYRKMLRETADNFYEMGRRQKERKPVKEIDWTRLTWKDINELERIINNVHYEFPHGIGEESFGKEVLERFRSTKGEDYLDEKEQKPIFRVGDSIIAKDGTCIPKEPFYIERVEDDCYWDGDSSILISNQDEFQLIEQKEQSTIEPKFKVGDRIKLSTEPKYPFREIVEIKDGLYYFDSAVHLPFQEQDKWEKEQKSVEWDDEYQEDIQTRFAFYTYKDDPSVLYLSNVFVEEASRNHGFGTRILKAAEKAAEAIGATKICLKVKQDSPANAWYRKRGYGYVAFEDGYDWLEKNLEYMKPNKPVEYLSKQKVFDIMNKLTELSYSERIPIHSNEYVKIHEITSDVNSLLDYPIKSVEWSEEDEDYLTDMKSAIYDYFDEGYAEELYGWLNSLPERFNLQPKQEWSDEDSDMICEIIDHCITIPYIGGTLRLSDERKKELKTFVKSLRPVKQEWSEEDEKMIDHLIEALPMWATGRIAMLPSQAEEYVKRLKSLRPQPKKGTFHRESNAVV